MKINGIIIDRVLLGLAESPTTGELLYTLTQLQDSTIDTTADKKEKQDSNGNLIKAFYQSKAASFTANNALLDLSVHASQAGTDKIIASDDNVVPMPKIMFVNKTTDTIELADLIDGTLQIRAVDGTGTIDDLKTYKPKAGTTASETEYGYTAPSDGATAKIVLPTDANVSRFIIKYERNVKKGVKVVNRADKYPKTIKFTLKVLGVDPCEKDVLKAYYIVFPSFQVSPETSTQLTTDATFEFKGDAEMDYCSVDKQLYYICAAEDDEENE